MEGIADFGFCFSYLFKVCSLLHLLLILQLLCNCKLYGFCAHIHDSLALCISVPLQCTVGGFLFLFFFFVFVSKAHRCWYCCVHSVSIFVCFRCFSTVFSTHESLRHISINCLFVCERASERVCVCVCIS